MSNSLPCPDEGPSADSLKRRGSWSRFKETVKETVQSLVGGSHQHHQHQPEEDPDVPSAVFPSETVNTATTNVDTVLHNTNCYSGSGARGATSLTRAMPIAAPPRALGKRPSVDSIFLSESVDVPLIVVTPEGLRQREAAPSRPVRRAESLRTPRTRPMVEVRARKDDDDDEDEIKKQMAILKIKQAIYSVKNDATDPQHGQQLGGAEAVVSGSGGNVSAASSPPRSSRGSISLSPSRKGAASGGRRKSESEAMMRRSGSSKKVKAKPMIWEHFDVIPTTNAQGKCKACRMVISCKYNTGNFVRHLQLAHKDVYRQYQNKIETQWTRSMMERNLK